MRLGGSLLLPSDGGAPAGTQNVSDPVEELPGLKSMAESKLPNRIGQYLKALRSEKGYTLAHVATRTGISQATLSKLENGYTQLTFRSLTKLAKGLNIPLSTLLPYSTKNTEVKQSTEVNVYGRRSITRSGKGARITTPDVDYEILCDELANLNQAFERLVIKIHSPDEQPNWRRHPGMEFIFVTKGVLVLYTEAYSPLKLNEGDCIVFDSTMGHKYVSSGKQNAEILIVVTSSGYKNVAEMIENRNQEGAIMESTS